MEEKPKFSARETYVLDPDEISQLDELSLTSVLRQVADPIEEPQKERNGKTLESEIARPASVSIDATIDELVEPSIPAGVSPYNSGRHSPSKATTDTESAVESLDDLIAPDLLFSDETDESNDDGAS